MRCGWWSSARATTEHVLEYTATAIDDSCSHIVNKHTRCHANKGCRRLLLPPTLLPRGVLLCIAAVFTAALDTSISSCCTFGVFKGEDGGSRGIFAAGRCDRLVGIVHQQAGSWRDATLSPAAPCTPAAVTKHGGAHAYDDRSPQLYVSVPAML
jgi:hypothetical protein